MTKKVSLPNSDFLEVRNVVVPMTMPLASHDAIPMALHDQQSHDHLELTNSVVLLAMPSASHDVNATPNASHDQRSCCTSFLIF